MYLKDWNSPNVIIFLFFLDKQNNIILNLLKYLLLYFSFLYPRINLQKSWEFQLWTFLAYQINFSLVFLCHRDGQLLVFIRESKQLYLAHWSTTAAGACHYYSWGLGFEIYLKIKSFIFNLNCDCLVLNFECQNVTSTFLAFCLIWLSRARTL